MTLEKAEMRRMDRAEWWRSAPGHWRVVRLKYLATKIGSGKTPLGGAAIYADRGVAFLRSQNVHFSGLRLDDIVYISREIDETMASTRVEPRDVLLNITGASLGRCTLVPESLGPANVNQHVCIVRTDGSSLSAPYLNYLLSSQPLQDKIFAGEDGVSREGLTFDRIGNFTLAIPAAREQQEICAFLDRETARIDALIEKKGRLIALLEEKRMALVNRAVARGLVAAVPMKASGIHAIPLVPNHWQVVRNKVLFRETDDRSTSEKEELLSVSHITGVTPRTEKDVSMFMAESTEGYKRCRSGDLVVNTMWAYMGALGISRHEGIVSPSYNVYRLRSEAVLVPEYFDLLCRTRAYICEITRESKGIWFSRLRLYPDAFLNLRTPLPPVSEQRAIIPAIQGRVAPLDGLTAKLRLSIAQLHEYRTALISAAVTGKIDVRGSGAESAAVHKGSLSGTDGG